MKRLREQAEEAEEETGEINLVPYMDIVTNIIIFLLASVVQNVPLGNVNVSSPTLGSSGPGSDAPEEKPLNLTVTASAGGFIVAASGGVLPNIPRKPDGKLDYKALTEKLMEIKKEYQSETKATFNADSDVPYLTVVETLDAMREDTAGKQLFPDVVFAAGIL
jgi:biopolymer transport protein ExbD